MTVNILQLTDLHLMTEPDATLKGVPTRAAFREMLEHVRHALASHEGEFEWVVITGDLAHDELPSTYAILQDLLADWLPRCLFLPGNHDHRPSIRERFHKQIPHDNDHINFSVAAGDWQLIGLDSHVPGEIAGIVDDTQLQWLAAELHRHDSRPTIIFVHHPPFSIQCPWLDELNLRESAALMKLLQTNPQVRVISTGHVHQTYEVRDGDVDCMTTPSTAVQFLPREQTPLYDAIPPGYRTFALSDGTYQTRVVRLSELRYPPDVD